MRLSRRPTKLIRILLALIVLLGSNGGSSTYGHTHGGHHFSFPDAWAPHDHDHGLADEEDDDDDDPHITDGVFHIHGLFLGMPLSLTGSSSREVTRCVAVP